MSQKYKKHRKLAQEELVGTEAFTALYKEPNKEIGVTFGVDEKLYQTDKEAGAQRAMLLGHHIRHLAESFGVDEMTAVSIALEASVGFESH